eukprot:CAMPEP_0117478630 /NCGR_PEP_ID=MMETSP0784-20121206/11462_1 /TAXON_ID=39447 /ORGANISM="" /LENGTH=221 /DNA_ID=CAMNT_0005273019 /DNA_START=33 /DNA_END=698 /DNA_ORIENTATION=+
MASMVAAEAGRLNETRYVEGQALRALQKTRANITTQRKVQDLLARAERLERQELTSGRQSLQNAEREFLFRKHASAPRQIGKDAAAHDGHRLSAAERLEGQAFEAFEGVHVKSPTKQQVERLRGNVAQLDRLEAATERQSKSGNYAVDPEVAGHAGHAGLRTIPALMKANSKLRTEHEQLMRKHAELVAEERLAENNAKLRTSNAELRVENAELSRELGDA